MSKKLSKKTALFLLKSGFNQKQTSKLVNASEKTITAWVKEFREKGILEAEPTTNAKAIEIVFSLQKLQEKTAKSKNSN